jgi:hypothetical protein
MEGHEYFSLRRSIEQFPNRNSLEHLMGMHALVIIDYKLHSGAQSLEYVNNLLYNIGNAIKLVVSHLCKCEYKSAMKDVCDKFAVQTIDKVTEKIEFDFLLLSTRGRRSVSESLKKFELYRNLLHRLLDDDNLKPKSYNFYQCAIGCMLSAKGLGFWLDETL